MRRMLVLACAAALAGCGGSGSKQPEVALLNGVAVESGRVVFTFESAPRKVSAAWVREAREDGSGRLLDVAGNAILALRFEPAATARVDGDRVEPTYTGPRRVPGSGGVREVVKAGDFEAVVTWAVGLEARRPYSLERDGDRVTVSFR